MLKTAGQIVEEAAEAVIEGREFDRGDDETAIQVLAWNLGEDEFTYEMGLAELAARAVEIDRAQRAT